MFLNDTTIARNAGQTVPRVDGAGGGRETPAALLLSSARSSTTSPSHPVGGEVVVATSACTARIRDLGHGTLRRCGSPPWNVAHLSVLRPASHTSPQQRQGSRATRRPGRPLARGALARRHPSSSSQDVQGSPQGLALGALFMPMTSRPISLDLGCDGGPAGKPSAGGLGERPVAPRSTASAIASATAWSRPRCTDRISGAYPRPTRRCAGDGVAELQDRGLHAAEDRRPITARRFVPMNKVSLPSPARSLPRRPAPSFSTPGFWMRLWQRLHQSEREAYLAASTDLADLERRMRAWDRTSADASMLKFRPWA